MTNEIIRDAKALAKGKWWKFVGVYLLMMLIAGVSGGIIGTFINLHISNEVIGSCVGGFLGGIVGSIFGFGGGKYFFDARKNEEKVSALFYGFSHFTAYLKFFASSLVIIVTLAVLAWDVIGLNLLVCISTFSIPLLEKTLCAIISVAAYICYFIYMLHYALYQYKIYDGKGIIESLKESKKISRGHKWVIFWTPIKFLLVPIIITIVGAILYACGAIAYTDTLFSGEMVENLLPYEICVTIGYILFIVAAIWEIVLMPTLGLICPVMYEKFNNKTE